jgi:SSS family solute:Na+ symporter
MHLQGNSIVLAVFLLSLLAVAISGKLTSRWHAHGNDAMEEWGLGGRQFGTLVTWFLVGGDFYTAYTIIAIPAAVYATGAAGFFALPYTIIVYPFVFLTMPRMWTVCRKHNLMTPADFVRARYGSHWLAAAIALTGIASLIPYIALQLTGMEAVLGQIGFDSKSLFGQALPVVLAFAAVSLFTFFAGLKAPASIAFAKDLMIYIIVIAAVILIPRHFGGYSLIFHQASQHFAATGTGSVILPRNGFATYSTLALGSALAAFMYPHTFTSVMASSSANVIRRNAILLPAYTFLLGLIALLGLVGAAAGLHLHSAKDVLPALLRLEFPVWFLGFAFAAIIVAALVPAAIMSIAAANLFTRNIYKEYLNPTASTNMEARVAKNASLGVNTFALLFVFFLPVQYAINLQLIGGILILQTLPAICFGLWRRIFHHQALLFGWAISMVFALVLLFRVHFASPIYTLTFGNQSSSIFIGLLALAVNLFFTATCSWLLDRAGVARLPDKTSPEEYVG